MNWKLKHNKSLTSTMHRKSNFRILVNCSKVIARQTGLSTNVRKVHQHENSKLPTLRDSKPNQMDSKWLEIWNIGSQVWTLDTLKVAYHETFLGVRYSTANTTSCRCLTLRVKCRFGNFSKMRLHRMAWNENLSPWNI